MVNARFLEEVDFGKEENKRNVVFKEEPVIEGDQVLIPIVVQEINPVIENNVPIIVDDIVQEQDNNEVLPQIPIQQPQEVSLRRSVRERRSSIPDDYIIFLQEHEDDIGLIEDDAINFYQAMRSSNSQN